MKINLSIILLLVSISIAYAQGSRTLVRDGNKHYEKEEYAKAIESYSEASKKAPHSAPPKYNLGDAMYQDGKYEEASEQFRKSAELTTDNTLKGKSYYNLGNAYLKSGKLDEAINAYKTALKHSPGDADIQYNLSYALKEKQKQAQQQQSTQNQQQQKEEEQQNKEKKEKPKPEMSQEEAEKLLKALENEEQKVRIKLQERTNNRREPKPSEKPW